MQKSRITAVFVPIFIGLFGIVNLMFGNRLEPIANMVIVTLLGSGMCFGIALATMLIRMRTRTTD